jgi:hypothetical protein
MIYMLCKICNKKQANARHIATHGLTHEEYLMKYENSLYWQRKVIEKFNELYVTVRYRFVEYGLKYKAITIKKENRKYGLNDKDLKQHLDGKKTVAIYTPEEKTKFMSFDIDVPDTGILETLVETLAVYIPREHILCSFSGRKGYHVDLFFSSLVDKSVTDKFYKLILSESGFSSKVVEGRGTMVHQALKLPLGFHVDTGAYCYLCNEFGVEIQDGTYGHATFCGIQPLEPQLIYDAVEMNYSNSYFTDEETIQLEELKEEVKTLPIYEGDVEYKRESIERLIKKGIHQPGERHQATYKIATYLKEEGYTAAEAKKFLEQWTFSTCNPAFYSSSEKEIRQDIKDTVNTVYRRDYKLKTKARDVTINKAELKEILSVKNQTLQRLYFILYTHCKAYGDNHGVFYMTYKQMEDMGAIKNNRSAMMSSIDKLVAAGKVEVVRRGERVERKRDSLSNKYRVIALQEELTVPIDGKTFTPCEQQSKECVDCSACHLLSKKEITESFGRRANEIMKQKARLSKRTGKSPLLCSTKNH